MIATRWRVSRTQFTMSLPLPTKWIYSFTWVYTELKFNTNIRKCNMGKYSNDIDSPCLVNVVSSVPSWNLTGLFKPKKLSHVMTANLRKTEEWVLGSGRGYLQMRINKIMIEKQMVFVWFLTSAPKIEDVLVYDVYVVSFKFLLS